MELQDQQQQYSRKNCVLERGIAEEKEEITDEVIINTISKVRPRQGRIESENLKKLEENLVLFL